MHASLIMLFCLNDVLSAFERRFVGFNPRARPEGFQFSPSFCLALTGPCLGLAALLFPSLSSLSPILVFSLLALARYHVNNRLFAVLRRKAVLKLGFN